jgi:hypothetical protein
MFNQVYDCPGYIAHPMHYLDFHPEVAAAARQDLNEQYGNR